MSLAGRKLGSSQWVPDKEKHDQSKANFDVPQASLSNSYATLGPLSSNTLLIQFTTSLLAITLFLLRRYQIPFLGFRVGLVFGVVPIECIMLSTMLLMLGIWDMANTVSTFYAPTNTEADEKTWTQDTSTMEA